jgi:hypothetical protein
MIKDFLSKHPILVRYLCGTIIGSPLLYSISTFFPENWFVEFYLGGVVAIITLLISHGILCRIFNLFAIECLKPELIAAPPSVATHAAAVHIGVVDEYLFVIVFVVVNGFLFLAVVHLFLVFKHQISSKITVLFLWCSSVLKR